METPTSILVIDDEPGIVEAIRLMLKREKYDIQTAPNGEDALSILHAGYVPHLIICDLNMPKMKGSVFVRKAIQHGVISPIAIISANADHEKIIECMELGAVGYFVKPFDAKTFLEKVRLLIEIGKNRLRERTITDGQSPEELESSLRIKISEIGNRSDSND